MFNNNFTEDSLRALGTLEQVNMLQKHANRNSFIIRRFDVQDGIVFARCDNYAYFTCFQLGRWEAI